MGVGTLAAGRVGLPRTGTFAADYVDPWLSGFTVGVGFLTLVVFAFLAAVYLTVESAQDVELQEDFRKRALGAGAYGAEVSEVFGKGGEGGRALAQAVDAACEKGGGKFRFLYPLEAPVKEKVETK